MLSMHVFPFGLPNKSGPLLLSSFRGRPSAAGLLRSYLGVSFPICGDRASQTSPFATTSFSFLTATCNVAVRKNNADGTVKSSLPLAVGSKNFYIGTALTWSE